MPTQTICAYFRRWRERRRRKVAVRELRAVDDRTLKDMGLTRGEIIAAVEGRVYRGEQPRRDEHTPPSPPAPEPARVETIDAPALQSHPVRACQLRAESLVALLRSGQSGIVRLLSVLARSKRTCRPAPDRWFGRAGAACDAAGERAP